MSRLKELAGKTTYILREAKKRFKNPAILWSTGKDSTVTIDIAYKAFFGTVPFPVVHIDTTHLFMEMYIFKEEVTKKYNLKVVTARNEAALEEMMNPVVTDPFNCCMALKTYALKQVLEKEKYDALILSIRWDEHPIRGMERFFSPRDEDWHWRVVRDKTEEEMKKGDAPVVSEQDAELAGWNIYATDFGEECSHVRVHPILHWSEIEVWRYIKENKVPWSPMYASMDGKRYRSLGCMPCTAPVESEATTIDEIIEELKITKQAERSGRVQDKEKIMERLRYWGYM